ncbi:MAG: hypothetical protein P4M15_08415 [Alphaproteobacteria bacterium]|nr:hypothetical protein [Alphaproteobacteria bacterium]
MTALVEPLFANKKSGEFLHRLILTGVRSRLFDFVAVPPGDDTLTCGGNDRLFACGANGRFGAEQGDHESGFNSRDNFFFCS